MTKRLTFEQLLEGESPVSLINEPVVIEEPKRESATARAMRRWFKQNLAAENEPVG